MKPTENKQESTIFGLRLPCHSDRICAILIALSFFACLFAHSDKVGIPRDESFYIEAADNAGEWYAGLFDSNVKSFSRQEIERGFKYNHEHPVLMKSLSGISHHLIHGGRTTPKQNWFSAHISHLTAYRLPAMLMAAMSLYLTFLLGAMVAGKLGGFAAALALGTMPHFFFHSSLACFDGPVTFMWLAITYCFIRGTRSIKWGVLSGLVLGFGFATKLNIFFLPFLLLGLAILDVILNKRRTGTWKAAEGRGPLTYYTVIAISMIVLGAGVFFAHWPWLWFDTWQHLQFYVSFHARHVHYPVDYLGHLLYRPPFPVHFPFIFSLFTVPVATIIFGFIGAYLAVRQSMRDLRETPRPEIRNLALIVNAIFPIALIALPWTPIFGGTKHWMPAMPFCAVFAGAGLAHISSKLLAGLKPLFFRPARICFVILMLSPAAEATATYGAHGAAYFNELAGGIPGAAALRMPRNFWGYSTNAVLNYITAAVPSNDQVFWHKATQSAINAYKRDGKLRSDITYSGDWTAPYSHWAIYHDQMEKWPEELDIWRSYGTEWPVDGFWLDGVSLITVYHRLK